MREYSTPAVAEIDRSASLTDVVFARAEREPGAVMLRRRSPAGPAPSPAGGAHGPWRDVTAAEFAAGVLELAKGLIASGIGAGDRVALMSATRYEWTLIDYAIWAAGAVTVPVYETSSAEQVEWVLKDSGARALFAETPAHLEAAGEMLPALPDVGHVWLIDGDAAGAQPLAALAATGTEVSDGQVHGRRHERTADDLATIVYTSGTTGRPKGCQLSHANLLADVRNVITGTLPMIFQEPGASTLLFLPLAHGFARVIQVGCLEARVVLGHTANVADLVGDLQSFQPTFLLAVPRVFEKVYNRAEQQASASPVKARIFAAAAGTAIAWSQALDGAAAGSGPGPGLKMRHALFDRLVYGKLRAAVGGRVRYAVSGGAPLGERLGHFFRGAGLTVLEGYGMTESSAAATVNTPERMRIGTVGQALPGVSVRIADDGEILLAGPTVFGGYWRNPAATAETLTGGWLRTGDLGALDGDGFLSVTGRKKELIVTAAGKNVAPAVLEDRIRAHWLVSQALVVGDGRPYVACLITLDDECLAVWKDKHSRPAGATAADLAEDPELRAELQAAVDEANKAVSRAESVRRFRVLPADFTEAAGHLTPSLKLRRATICKEFAAEIDALYS